MPLSLVHGWGLGRAWWTALCTQWTHGPVVLVDLPGYTPPHTLQARHPATPTTDHPTFDAAVDALIDTAAPDGLLCGWSLGALVALAAVHRLPQRWQGLVLIGATPCFMTRADWPDGTPPAEMAQLSAHVLADRHGALRRFSAQVLLGGAKGCRMAAPRAPVCTAWPDTATLQQGLACLQTLDLRTLCPTCPVPVHLIHGARDAVVPVAAARWMATAFPQAELQVFEDAGHAPFLSHAHDIQAGLVTFARKHQIRL